MSSASNSNSNHWNEKVGLAKMLCGGVIMDVTTAEEAKIAESAKAEAVMALERVPADIRRDGGVARMAAVAKIKEIQERVSIPVMAKARIGHFVEAQILQELRVDFIDESEVGVDLTYYLAEHPEIANSLEGLSPRAMDRKLMRLEDKLEAQTKQPKPITQAKAPISSSKGKSAGVSNIANQTGDNFLASYRARRAQQRT